MILRTAAAALLLGGAAVAAPLSRHAAEQSLTALAADASSMTVVWRPDEPTPARVTGLRATTRGATPEARARDFLATWPALLALAEAPTLMGIRTLGDSTVVRLQPTHGGRRVADRTIAVTLDAAGRVTHVVSDATPLTTVAPAVIDAAAARALAIRHVLGLPDEAPLPDLPTRVEPVVLATGDQGVEGFEVTLSRAPLQEHLVVRVDAHAGAVLGVTDQVKH